MPMKKVIRILRIIPKWRFKNIRIMKDKEKGIMIKKERLLRLR